MSGEVLATRAADRRFGQIVPEVAYDLPRVTRGNLRWARGEALNAADVAVAFSIGDILADPGRLANLGPDAVAREIANPPPTGWQAERLGQGSHKGQGWVLREYTPDGVPTGRLIRWHSGGGRHGPGPYWRVCSPEHGRSDRIPG